MSKLNANDFNDPIKENVTAKDFAEALVVMMGATTDLQMTFESLGFSPAVHVEFEKGMKRIINAVSSSVPNQFRNKVLRLVAKAAEKADEQLDTRTNLDPPTADSNAYPQINTNAFDAESDNATPA